MLFVAWLLGAVLIAFFGRHLRFGFWGYFFASILLTPAIGLLLLFAAIPRARPREGGAVTRPAALTTPEATRALAIVKHYTILCAEAMWIPFWWASSPSITALQLKMLEEVSQVYGVEVSPDRTKALVASLGGGGLSLIISQHPLSLAVKAWVLAIPIIGIPLRLGTGPAIMAGYTWLLGQAFITHYESGGTYLDFRMRQVGAQLRDTVGMPRTV